MEVLTMIGLGLKKIKNKALLLKLFCAFVFSTTICVLCIQNFNYEQYVVPGTVISKDTEQYAHGKNHRNMSTRYIMCVKPYDTNKFNYYSLYVTYTTYCTHDVGDKIAFSISEKECLKDFKQQSEWVECTFSTTAILFALLSIVLFSTIIATIIVDATEN